MFSIEVHKIATGIALTPRGDIDGSAAWRVVRLARRFGRGNAVILDLGEVERLLPFGASVLAQELPRDVIFRAARPEHTPTLVWAGLDRAVEVEDGDELDGDWPACELLPAS